MIKQMLTLLCCFSCLFSENEAENSKQKRDLPVVVFDFGGVIAEADTTQMSAFLMNSFVINKEELSTALRSMQGFISKGGSEKEYWMQYALSKRVVLSNNWLDQWANIIKKSIKEIPETIVIVKILQSQGYQTAMLSDVTQYQAEVIRKMGYYDLFNPVLLSYEIGVKKPNPETFKILLETLRRPASDVLFIDDRIENVEAAKNLGIDSILFSRKEQLKTDLEKRGFDVNTVPTVCELL